MPEGVNELLVMGIGRVLATVCGHDPSSHGAHPDADNERDCGGEIGHEPTITALHGPDRATKIQCSQGEFFGVGRPSAERESARGALSAIESSLAPTWSRCDRAGW